MVSVSFGVTDSQNEAQFAPSLRMPKKTISSQLNINNNEEIILPMN